MHVSMRVSDAVFEYLTERYFFDLNTRMIEESKQAVSIGPSLLSAAHKTAQKSASGTNGLTKSERTELAEINVRGSKRERTIRTRMTADNKRKEKCSIV